MPVDPGDPRAEQIDVLRPYAHHIKSVAEIGEADGELQRTDWFFREQARVAVVRKRGDAQQRNAEMRAIERPLARSQGTEPPAGFAARSGRERAIERDQLAVIIDIL